MRKHLWALLEVALVFIAPAAANAACPYTGNTSGTDSAAQVSALNDICSNTGTSGANAAQASPGSDATKALAVQGVTGGKALPASQSGTWTVQPGNTANTTPWVTQLYHQGIATYSYMTSAYTAYATPTDMFGICGSATKTVQVSNIFLGVQSTATALQSIQVIKRSTADTGGTDSAPSPIAWDSADAAATASLHLYTAAPSLGTTVGNLRLQAVVSATLTAAPAIIGLTNGFNPASTTLTTSDKPVTLHGTAECVYLNYAGAALTSGFTAYVAAQWTEY